DPRLTHCIGAIYFLGSRRLFQSDLFFFFNHAAPTALYTLSLHDALPIYPLRVAVRGGVHARALPFEAGDARPFQGSHSHGHGGRDRKSTRLNSSHDQISYAVFCLKKKIAHYRTRRPWRRHESCHRPPTNV